MQAFWGLGPAQGSVSWVNNHSGGTTPITPDENDFVEKAIPYVTRDYPIDARGVGVFNDWRFGNPSMVGFMNSGTGRGRGRLGRSVVGSDQ
jgi:hypothetical protein